MYTTKPGWISAIYELLKKYYMKESRVAVRCKTLQSLLQIYKSNRQIHEEEIIKSLVLPSLAKIDEEPQTEVKLEAIKVITGICIECSSKRCVDLLDILEKIIMKPLENKASTDKPRPAQKASNFQDVQASIEGLIEIFCARLCQHPASNAVRAYHILVKHLEMSYANLDIFSGLGATRKGIFQLMMKLRANAKFHLGVETQRGSSEIHFSPYLICRSPLKQVRNIGKTSLI